MEITAYRTLSALTLFPYRYPSNQEMNGTGYVRYRQAPSRISSAGNWTSLRRNSGIGQAKLPLSRGAFFLIERIPFGSSIAFSTSETLKIPLSRKCWYNPSFVSFTLLRFFSLIFPSAIRIEEGPERIL